MGFIRLSRPKICNLITIRKILGMRDCPYCIGYLPMQNISYHSISRPQHHPVRKVFRPNITFGSISTLANMPSQVKRNTPSSTDGMRTCIYRHGIGPSRMLVQPLSSTQISFPEPRATSERIRTGRNVRQPVFRHKDCRGQSRAKPGLFVGCLGNSVSQSPTFACLS